MRSLALVCLAALPSLSFNIYTNWDEQNIRFSHPNEVSIKELSGIVDSIWDQRRFEITLPGEANKVELVVGIEPTIAYAGLKVQASNNFATSVAFKQSAIDVAVDDIPTLWAFQDTSIHHFDNDTTNFQRISYVEFVAGDYEFVFFSYSESNNHFYFKYSFYLPITVAVEDRKQALIKLMAGVEFIKKNLGGKKENLTPGVAAKGLKKRTVKINSWPFRFDILGRPLPREPLQIPLR